MRPLIGRRRLGPIPVTPKCWKEGAGVAQCKVHPESPLSGHPAADTSDPVRFGGLPVPRPLESLGSWKPPARRAADPWSEPLDRDCPPPPPTRAGTSSLHPLPGGCSEAKTATSSLIGYLDALWAGAVKHRGGSGTRCPALPGVFLQWRSW